jgi:hypothetical protein
MSNFQRYETGAHLAMLIDATNNFLHALDKLREQGHLDNFEEELLDRAAQSVVPPPARMLRWYVAANHSLPGASYYVLGVPQKVVMKYPNWLIQELGIADLITPRLR